MKQHILSCESLARRMLADRPCGKNPLASMKAMFDGFQNKSINPSLFADDFVD